MQYFYILIHEDVMNLRFRFMPLNFVLFLGESLKMVLNDSSVKASQSFLLNSKMAGRGAKDSFVCGVEKRFQGHTSWHTSQPKSQSSNFPFIFSGISASFNSMVK